MLEICIAEPFPVSLVVLLLPKEPEGSLAGAPGPVATGSRHCGAAFYHICSSASLQFATGSTWTWRQRMRAGKSHRKIIFLDSFGV